MSPPQLVEELTTLLPPGNLLTEVRDLVSFGQDWGHRLYSVPRAVVYPVTAEQVQAIICWARRRHVALVPSGGRTGLSGGAAAGEGEVVVSLARMNHILGFDANSRSLSLEAGVVTQTIQQFAADRGFYYPVDFASRGSSQIGGNIATNAGGIRVLRYGLTRNWVTGLKVVTGGGELLHLNRGLIKNATGYDLRHLFIGSEGTLGIIVEATLQLTNPPPQQQVMLLSVPSLSLIMEVFRRIRHHLTLSAFEFFTDRALHHVVAAGARSPFASDAPCYLVAEFDSDEVEALRLFEECLSAGLVCDGVLSQSETQAKELWRLREGITESLSRYRPYKNDVSVPVDAIPAFLDHMNALFVREYPDFEVIWFGHIGDGNMHINVLPPEDCSSEAFFETCRRVTHQLGGVLAEFGGSISAEHGVGVVKRPFLHYSRSAAELELMRRMKEVFDPDGIMNPGKLLPP